MGRQLSKSSWVLIKLMSLKQSRVFHKSFRLPPYGTRLTLTIHTLQILLCLSLMAHWEQSSAKDNHARWHRQ